MVEKALIYFKTITANNLKKKGNNESLVSIGLPVFNGEPFLKQAISSILDQNYRNFELIISDNASTDGTERICQLYAAHDNRIQYHRNDRNIGPVANFNRVFELSAGAYFMWAGHDDYWDANYLSVCLKVLKTHDSTILVGTMCNSIDSVTGELILTDGGLSTINLSPLHRFKRYKSIIHGGTYIGGIFYGIYKRDALLECMPLKNNITIDHLLLSELCFHGDFITVQRPLMTKRCGGTSVSIKNIARSFGITNHFRIIFPYLDREITLQSIIFRTDKIALSEKIVLSGWSFCNYVALVVKSGMVSLTPLLYSAVARIPACIKRPIKTIIKSW